MFWLYSTFGDVPMGGPLITTAFPVHNVQPSPHPGSEPMGIGIPFDGKEHICPGHWYTLPFPILIKPSIYPSIHHLPPI